jgi:hypothetical protein
MSIGFIQECKEDTRYFYFTQGCKSECYSLVTPWLIDTRRQPEGGRLLILVGDPPRPLAPCSTKEDSVFLRLRDAPRAGEILLGGGGLGQQRFLYRVTGNMWFKTHVVSHCAECMDDCTWMCHHEWHWHVEWEALLNNWRAFCTAQKVLTCENWTNLTTAIMDEDILDDKKCKLLSLPHCRNPSCNTVINDPNMYVPCLDFILPFPSIDPEIEEEL